MTPEVKTAILRLLKVKHKQFLSGGYSPFSRLYNSYEQEQRFVLGLFGLRDIPENLRLFSQPLFDFVIEDASSPTVYTDPVIYDGTSRSMYRETGRRFMAGTRSVHLRNIEEKAELLFNRLYERATALNGLDVGEG
jgi:hypothetical protein